MTEQTLSGGYFGGSSSGAPPMSAEFAVHGGFFGGVPLGANPAAPTGAQGDWDDVIVACLETFGDEVLAEYQPAGGAPFILPHGVVFRAAHLEVDPETGAPVSSRQPHATARAAELPEDWTKNDLLVVRGRLFRIRDIQPDGETGAKLVLHEVAA